MKNIFSNIKHIALSLLVGGLAIGTQAFTSAVKSKKLDVIYYHYPDNSYRTAIPTGPNVSCKPILEDPCTVTFSSAQSSNRYDDFGSLPSGGTASVNEGDWE